MDASVLKRAEILLVEDEPISQRVAQLMLEGFGHRVDVVDSGQKAIEQVSGQRYDLVFMDLGLPDMTGDQVTLKIRQLENNGKRVPIIALTAHVFHNDKKRCLAAGMDGFLGKPIEYPELRTTLEEWLKD